MADGKWKKRRCATAGELAGAAWVSGREEWKMENGRGREVLCWWVGAGGLGFGGVVEGVGGLEGGEEFEAEVLGFFDGVAAAL